MGNFCEMCEEMGLDYRCKENKGVCIFEENLESVTPMQEKVGKVEIVKVQKDESNGL